MQHAALAGRCLQDRLAALERQFCQVDSYMTDLEMWGGELRNLRQQCLDSFGKGNGKGLKGEGQRQSGRLGEGVTKGKGRGAEEAGAVER